MEIKIPTPGRIVHFHHNGDEEYKAASSNEAKFVPAIVTQPVDGLVVNITIFPVGKHPLYGWSIQHESEAEEDSPYWSYPEIK